MTSRDFIYHPKLLENQLKTIIQTKIKTVAKCYSVTDFKINEDEKTFTYFKSYKINRIHMKDPKEHVGTYNIETIDDVTSKITISI